MVRCSGRRRSSRAGPAMGRMEALMERGDYHRDALSSRRGAVGEGTALPPMKIATPTTATPSSRRGAVGEGTALPPMKIATPPMRRSREDHDRTWREGHEP
jgi:hypothetical protein